MAHADTPATDTTGAIPADADSVRTASTAPVDAADRTGADAGPAEADARRQDAQSVAASEALRLDGLAFDIEKSMRYHRRRQAHYERWHRWSMLAVIVLGSAAAARYKSSEALFGLSAAVIGALDLVYSPSIKAAEHAELHRRFSDLLASIRSAEAAGPDRLRQWEVDRLTIEANEPPTYWALEADCWNETARAMGRRKEPFNRIGWRRPLKHLVRFEGADFAQQPA
jgi:hypothetical protein